MSEPRNSTSAFTNKFIPNAEPHPVDIAFIIVAEPGDCTLVFKVSPKNGFIFYFQISKNISIEPTNEFLFKKTFYFKG
jgi:hypothetical protein